MLFLIKKSWLLVPRLGIVSNVSWIGSFYASNGELSSPRTAVCFHSNNTFYWQDQPIIFRFFKTRMIDKP